jgi:hypothetical protein
LEQRTKVPRISSHQSGITNLELAEAIPEGLLDRSVHLHWIDKSPAGKGRFTLTAKIEIDGQVLLLSSKTNDLTMVENWNLDDPSYHTNARLLALERILTDPANEDILLSL